MSSCLLVISSPTTHSATQSLDGRCNINMSAKITHFETHGMFALLQLIRFVRFEQILCRKRYETSCDFGVNVAFPTIDVRFPTSLTGDGTDAMCALFRLP